jgi:hypothetical protein
MARDQLAGHVADQRPRPGRRVARRCLTLERLNGTGSGIEGDPGLLDRRCAGAAVSTPWSAIVGANARGDVQPRSSSSNPANDATSRNRSRRAVHRRSTVGAA